MLSLGFFFSVESVLCTCFFFLHFNLEKLFKLMIFFKKKIRRRSAMRWRQIATIWQKSGCPMFQLFKLEQLYMYVAWGQPLDYMVCSYSFVSLKLHVQLSPNRGSLTHYNVESRDKKLKLHTVERGRDKNLDLVLVSIQKQQGYNHGHDHIGFPLKKLYFHYICLSFYF